MTRPTSEHRLPRAIAPNIHWMGACLARKVDGTELHSHASCYLIVGETKTLLVDTGRPNSWGEISRNLDEVLGERSIDYLFPTHPELPHSGNLGRLAEKYPDATIVGDTRDYHLFYPATEPRLEPKVPGDEIDLGGGYRFVVTEAVIRDLPNTQWGYEAKEGVLFTSDGFAFMHDGDAQGKFDDPTHLPGECGLLTSEIDGPISVEYAAFYTGSAIYWTRFIDDSEELFGKFEALLEAHPSNVLAPGHGNVVDSLEEVLPVMKQAHREAFAHWSSHRVS